MTGRERCNKLKAIRKALADKMGIDLHQTVCTYEGECKGTCPKCKQEERALNAAIMRKGTAVAGATLLATSLAACGPSGNIGPLPDGDIMGDMSYIGDDTDDHAGTGVSQDGGDDDIVELTGEVDEFSDEDDDGCDDGCDGRDDGIQEIDEVELSGDVAIADME